MYGTVYIHVLVRKHVCCHHMCDHLFLEFVHLVVSMQFSCMLLSEYVVSSTLDLALSVRISLIVAAKDPCLTCGRELLCGHSCQCFWLEPVTQEIRCAACRCARTNVRTSQRVPKGSALVFGLLCQCGCPLYRRSTTD
jgi:hypothetical protein